MSLRAIAMEDLDEIMTDTETGGDDCVITSPAAVEVSFKCLHNDIHQAIDPGTGEVITGRQASIAVQTSDLIAASFEDIRGIADPDSAPWLVTVADVHGRSATFKVAESYPDATLGLTVLVLEFYL